MKVVFGSSAELQVNLTDLWQNEALPVYEPASFLLSLACIAEH